MFIPSEVTHALASGVELKGVTCRHCGQQFAYIMGRTGMGRGQALLGFGSYQAGQAAQESAGMQYAQLMGTQCDPIPCPQCRQLQPDMLAALKRRAAARWAKGVGLALLPAAVLLFLAGQPVTAALGVVALVLTIPAYVVRVRTRMWLHVPPRHVGEKAPAWTRQDLETLAAADPSLDISPALLDWERQRIYPGE